MAPRNDIQRVRRENIRALIEKWGGPSTLGKRLGHSGPSYLSQLISGKRPITEKVVRKMENELHLALGALDAEPGAALPFAGTDHPVLAASIRALADEIERAKIEISSKKQFELVALVYEHAVNAGGKIDPAYVQRVLKLVA